MAKGAQLSWLGGPYTVTHAADSQATPSGKIGIIASVQYLGSYLTLFENIYQPS